jgi:hypothetical protein
MWTRFDNSCSSVSIVVKAGQDRRFGGAPQRLYLQEKAVAERRICLAGVEGGEKRETLLQQVLTPRL